MADFVVDEAIHLSMSRKISVESGVIPRLGLGLCGSLLSFGLKSCVSAASNTTAAISLPSPSEFFCFPIQLRLVHYDDGTLLYICRPLVISVPAKGALSMVVGNAELAGIYCGEVEVFLGSFYVSLAIHRGGAKVFE
jgi:hypothetical protein